MSGEGWSGFSEAKFQFQPASQPAILVVEEEEEEIIVIVAFSALPFIHFDSDNCQQQVSSAHAHLSSSVSIKGKNI